MADLTLKEVLTDYEAECREVLSPDQWHSVNAPLFDSAYQRELLKLALIGACNQWLAGKGRPRALTLTEQDGAKFYYLEPWPREPLRYGLEEVWIHMEADNG